MVHGPECEICYEKYNSVNRYPITCLNPECNETCCMMCLRKVTLDSLDESPKCMHCDTIFNDDYLNDSITNKFRNELWDHKVNTVYNLQLSMLPATQPDIIFKQKSEEYREKTLTMLYDLQLQIALLNTSYG